VQVAFQLVLRRPIETAQESYPPSEDEGVIIPVSCKLLRPSIFLFILLPIYMQILKTPQKSKGQPCSDNKRDRYLTDS
jgi:hypothetical protein